MQQTGFAAANGSPSALAYSFKEAPGSGFYRQANGSLVFLVAGVPILQLTSTGVVLTGAGFASDDLSWSIDDWALIADALTWTIGSLGVTASGDVTFTPTGDFVVTATDDITLTADDLTFTGDDVTWTCDNFAISSNEASALAVGPNGVTGPTLLVDASTASAANGLKILSGASNSVLALSVVGGTNEVLTINGKGTGRILIGSVSTGLVQLGRGSLRPAMQSSTVTTDATAGPLTMTATMLLGGIIRRDPVGSDRTDVTDTAANILSLGSMGVGDTLYCYYINTADAAETITISGGTNVTVTNPLQTIAQNESALLLLRATSGTTMTLDIIGG